MELTIANPVTGIDRKEDDMTDSPNGLVSLRFAGSCLMRGTSEIGRVLALLAICIGVGFPVPAEFPWAKFCRAA
ncbi:MAG: hypothetical protein IT349_09125 [Candidatus Eisenbacteria bacterium]|nr:hypothetical protein [Candidatus Eisenbacteria bacterium]